jgi:hypothetical protein
MTATLAAASMIWKNVCWNLLRRWARLIQRKGWAKDDPTLRFTLSESDELIRIFMSSIRTAQQNALKQKRTPDTTRIFSGETG